MTIQQPQENLTSAELLDKAKKALTPEQYQRMQDKAIEKIGIIKLSSMSLDGLKSELPALAQGEPDEQDILSRLEAEFPGIKPSETSSKKESASNSEAVKFTEHPLDYSKQKLSEAGDWVYENLVPERLKKAKEMSKEGASGKAVAATVLGGVSAGQTVQMAEKMTSWTERLMKDPVAWFKELFSVLFSFDFKRIKAFFSSTLDQIGITSSMAEKFAGMLGVPESITKYAKKLFSLDIFGKMNYGDLSKVWEKFQKNPELNLMKELGMKEGSNAELGKVLGSIFGKNNKNIIAQFTEKEGADADISKFSMADIISRIGA